MRNPANPAGRLKLFVMSRVQGTQLSIKVSQSNSDHDKVGKGGGSGDGGISSRGGKSGRGVRAGGVIRGSIGPLCAPSMNEIAFPSESLKYPSMK